MPELRLPKGWQMYAMLPATEGTPHRSTLYSAATDGSGLSVSLTEPRSLHVVQRQRPRLLVQLSDDDRGVREREVEVQQHKVTGNACQDLHTAMRCITQSRIRKNVLSLGTMGPVANLSRRLWYTYDSVMTRHT